MRGLGRSPREPKQRGLIPKPNATNRHITPRGGVRKLEFVPEPAADIATLPIVVQRPVSRTYHCRYHASDRANEAKMVLVARVLCAQLHYKSRSAWSNVRTIGFAVTGRRIRFRLHLIRPLIR